MLYAVYNPDGMITQATKTYDQPDYGKMLADHAMPYVELNLPTLISDAEWFVNTNNEELCERPIMATIQLTKQVIEAGSSDSCVATGIPKNAKATITMRDGTVIVPQFTLDATELEISIPVPCTYRVTFELWPYRTFTYEVEAVTR